jgi:drug/metabolite transporter (DMT)-like permease
VPPGRRRLLPWIALSVVYVVWGSTYLAIRIVVREMPPLTAASLRFVTAGLVVGGVALVVDRGKPRPSRRQRIDYALVGVLLLGAGNGLVMWAETRIPSSIAALIAATVPVWITLLDGLRPGGQPWTARVWLGTLLGLAGVAAIARPGGGVTAGHWPGVVALLCASLGWTVGALYTKSIPSRLPLFSATAIQMLAGGLALFVESRVLGEEAAGLWTASFAAWAALVYLLVFGALIGFTAFAYCLNELPAGVVGTYAYVNPVVAVALGRLFLDEPVSTGLISGAGLVLLGVLLSTTGEVTPRTTTVVGPRR